MGEEYVSAKSKQKTAHIPALVDWIEVTLVQVDDEHDVIPETAHSRHSWHPYDEGEQVVDELNNFDVSAQDEVRAVCKKTRKIENTYCIDESVAQYSPG